MGKHSGQVKILIVDDDFSSRRHLARLIRTKWTCTVLEAEEGSEALRMILKENPDLVILDMVMPFMSGLEVLKTMRGYSKMAHIPVIVCSALDDEKDVSTIIKLGVSDYIVKPINRTILTRKIAEVLEATDKEKNSDI